MKNNEKIYVKSFECETTEDDWENGEIGNVCSRWTDSDVKIKNGNRGFDSVEDALKAVCDANCFKYSKQAWMSFGRDCGEDYGRFDGDVTVDEDNYEATDSQLAEWKEGRRRLWTCHIYVWLEVRAVRELTEDEANKF